MSNQFVVDSKFGPYKSIQAAINAAPQNSIIKIGKGIYNENIIIRKNGLKIQPRDEIGDIILVASKGACILVDLQQDEKVEIEGIKIAHCGNNDGMYFYFSQLINFKSIFRQFKANKIRIKAK